MSPVNPSVVAVDIRTDSDNDGDVEGALGRCGDEDDSIENDPVLGKGMLLSVNNNDSNDDGMPDYLNTVHDGVTDEQDFRDVYLHVVAVPAGSMRLSIAPTEVASRLRLFDDQWNYMLGAPALDENGEPTGPAVSEVELPVAQITNQCWKHFHVEGVEPGVVRIRMAYISPGGAELGSDAVKIIVYRVSSFFPDEHEDVEVAPPSTTLAVSADEPSFPYTTSIDFVDENGQPVPAENGSQVSWQVLSGAATLSTLASTTVNGFTSTFVTAPTTAGSTFQVAARVTRVNIGGASFPINGIEHRSRPVVVQVGRPDDVQSVFDGGIAAYAASEQNKVALTVTAKDAHDNDVPDGTEMVVDMDGDGLIDGDVTDTEVTDGSARAGTVAGFAPGAQELTVTVGERELTHTITELPIVVTLVPSAQSVVAGSDNFVDIVATVLASDGSPVADGSEIVWLSSLGSLAPTGGARTGPITTTMVNGGHASVRLHTAATDLLGEVISGTDMAGTARVIAAIGYSQARVSIEFTATSNPGGPAPILVHVDHRALAGDATSNGTVEVDELTFQSRYDQMISIANLRGSPAAECPTCDLDGDGVISLVDLIWARNGAEPAPPTAPYFAVTSATVSGNPYDVVQVSVSNPALVTLSGVDGQGQVTLNAAGRGAFSLQSTGALTDGIVLVHVTATRIGPSPLGGPDEDDEDEVTLVVVPKAQHGWLYNLTAGAVWGGGEGFASFAGDATTSLFLVGDIRDVVVQTAKLWPGGESPDLLVLGFAGAGVISTFAGPELDGPVGILKVVIKKIRRLIPGSAGGEIIAKVVKTLTSQVHSVQSFLAFFNEWKAFFKAIAGNDAFVRLIRNFSEELMTSTRRVLSRLGESWAGHLAKAAADVTVTGTKRAIAVIDAVDDATVALLKGWSPARQERLVVALAKSRGKKIAATGKWAGRIDEDVLKSLMHTNKIAVIEQHWTQFDVVMEQLGKVARNGTENTAGFAKKLDDRLADYLGNPDPGNVNRLKGHLNELRQMSGLTETPGLTLLSTSAYVNKSVRDIDGVAQLAGGQKVIYEFKFGSTWSSPSSRRRADLVDQIRARVELAADTNSDLHGAVVKVRLSGATWGNSITTELQSLGTGYGVSVIVESVP